MMNKWATITSRESCGMLFACLLVTNMQPYTREPTGEENVLMATSHELTLLDVIQAVSEVTENDLEVVATVMHLISSGQVRLHNDAIEAIRNLAATVDAAA
jgi:hypothetical protein